MATFPDVNIFVHLVGYNCTSPQTKLFSIQIIQICENEIEYFGQKYAYLDSWLRICHVASEAGAVASSTIRAAVPMSRQWAAFGVLDTALGPNASLRHTIEGQAAH